MAKTYTREGEKIGKHAAEVGRAADKANTKAQRARRVLDDEEVRGRLIIGAVSALVATAVGIAGYFAFKRRDDIKKGLKDARDTLKDKIEHHTSKTTTPKTTA